MTDPATPIYLVVVLLRQLIQLVEIKVLLHAHHNVSLQVRFIDKHIRPVIKTRTLHSKVKEMQAYAQQWQQAFFFRT